MKCLGYIFLIISINSVISENDYENRLTNLWQLGSEAKSRTPLNEPSVVANVVKFIRKSRIISPNGWMPTTNAKPTEEQTQMERTVRYRRNEFNNHNGNTGKTEILFPGNYFPIADVKTKENSTEFNQFEKSAETFVPKAIPLMRNREFYGKSADGMKLNMETDSSQPDAMRRSISYFDDEEAEEDYEEGDDGLEEEDEGLSKKKHKKKKLKKYFKMAKYMLPLLLAYKLKFFTLIPLLKGLLVLLTGSTGLAGFFFALFAAVIGLKTGNWA